MTLEAQIEALLFWRGEPVSYRQLAAWLNAEEPAVREATSNLAQSLTSRGITLVNKDNEVMLGTAPEMGETIERLTKEELSKDLGKAALETLTIILYKGPIARAEIDYIRGVNSSFILRNLQIRGLVERIANPDDSRSFLYRPTFDLLQHLGITSTDQLPEHGTLVAQIENFVETQAKAPEAGS